MRERRELVRKWRQGGATVLVTLVAAEGSSYRRPGARLLLGAAGDYAGTISGGCLEGEVVRKAEWLVREGAAVERYSTMFDDTAEVPFGLGCGGVVDLLLEPVDTAEGKALMTALERSIAGEESTVWTWLPGRERRLRRVVLAGSGEVLFASETLTEAQVLDLSADAQRQDGKDREDREGGVFSERLDAPQRLFVLGAGDDAKPLVTMAALLGWSVAVMEGRLQLARADRFPEAERVEVIEGASIERLEIRSEDAVVLMTHSYEQDKALLAAVLPLGPRYFGLLGARHRSALLVSEVAALLGWSVAQCCERIYAPVGLDLGGDGPEAIALAVIAEAQACCTGKLGTSRRLSSEDVASHVRGWRFPVSANAMRAGCRLMSVSVVILAAGASSRFGSPKQLATIDGETLLERAVRVAREAGCEPVIVVLGASAEAIVAGCALASVRIVVNESWEEGMGASIRAGVAALRDVEGCVVMTCDMPAVTPAHLRALMGPGDLMASLYAGRCGVPAYFPASTFSALLRLEGDTGAREMLRSARSHELPGGEVDIDGIDDLARATRRL